MQFKKKKNFSVYALQDLFSCDVISALVQSTVHT